MKQVHHKSPHTEKIYIGCSSLPLNRAVSGLRASAKFRKLSCNILFQAGDIQSEVLEKFQIVIGTGRHELISLSAEQYLQKLRLILPKIQGYLPLSKLMLIDVSAPGSNFDIKESSAEDDDECKLEEHKVECLSANAECRRFHQRYA